MSISFDNIALIGRHRTNTDEIHNAIKQIHKYLINKGITVWIEEETATKY